MKCEFCDHEASVFLTQLIDGNMKKVCLCESCAKERGVTDPTGFSLADLLFGGAPPGVATATAPKTMTPIPTGDKTCPACGFTLEDLRRVRRFGCSECYSTFSEEVAQMVRGMHSGTTHQGKVPAGLMARQVLHQRLEELRLKLDEAITTECYEDAAQIRDQIQQLSQTQV